MFKKKAEPPADVKSVQETEKSSEDQMDAGPPATDPQLVSALLTVCWFFLKSHINKCFILYFFQASNNSLILTDAACKILI